MVRAVLEGSTRCRQHAPRTESALRAGVREAVEGSISVRFAGRNWASSESTARLAVLRLRRPLSLVILVVWQLLLVACREPTTASETSAVNQAEPNQFVGSESCRSCHESFYEKWSTSHHGLAMQPYTRGLADSLTDQDAPITVGGKAYRADPENGAVVEESDGESRRYPILHAMGGKNVYFFLTPLERGRLQVLPIAFDINGKFWYDTAAAGVRMHGDSTADEALPWTDPAFTFNTSCFTCHVSQLEVNYDAEQDTYKTTWGEPGISCETCHGPGDAHVALFEPDPDMRPDDIRVLRFSDLTSRQRNETCAPCHAKMVALTDSYGPTQRFFDNYDLVTFESSDFYPDGRDLGENYTYTTWLMSPCLEDESFDCLHCHTSSGRYRFAGSRSPNAACLPCHEEQVEAIAEHSHHDSDGEGGECIACHMPQTRFANMVRSDHSMRPPTPATTIQFDSPNACNLCHHDKDAEWSDEYVREWNQHDYQEPVLYRASLIDEARKQEWDRLSEMLEYLADPKAEPVFQTSLIRLLASCPDPAKWPQLRRSAREASSPLVRGAALAVLGSELSRENLTVLIGACRDEYRLVRIRAAGGLGQVPRELLPPDQRSSVEAASRELIAAFEARADDFAGLTNLGNYHLDRGQLDESVVAFERAISLRPDSVGTLVNASIAYSRKGLTSRSERVLRQALEYAPQNAAVHFNLGLLMAEMGRIGEAESALEKALEADPRMAQAAFNLCVLRADRDLDDAIAFCRQAVRLEPGNERYGSALQYYLDRAGSGE